MDGVRVLIVVVPVLLSAVVVSLVIRFDPLPATAIPLDLGRTWRDSPILGPNKTWRGLVVWVVATAVFSALVFPVIPPTAVQPSVGWFGFGLLLGTGYAVAELPNSFIKRRLGIAAGAATTRHARWQYLADQGDSVLGMLVVVVLVLDVEWPWLLLLTALGLLLHVLGDTVLHATGIKSGEPVTAG